MIFRNYLLVTVLAGSALSVEAQEVNLAGDAMGLFNGSTTAYGGLSYLDSTFDVWTSLNFYALGGDPNTPNLDNLGSFTLSTSAFDYNNPPTTFTLYVTFTAPTGIAGSGTGTYTADLIGQVINSNTGGVFIDFGTAPLTFFFSNPSGSGTFSLAVDPLSLYPGQTASLTGYGYAHEVVPAPAALACMGLGLAGAALRRRRYR